MSGLITAAAVIATATVYSAVEAGKGRRDQKRAREVQAKSDKLTTQRSAVEQVRQAQIARASVAQGGENTGVAGSSAIQGATGSIQSQAGGNLGFAQQIFNHQQAKNKLLESAFGHMGKAANAQAVASVASTVAGVIE